MTGNAYIHFIYFQVRVGSITVLESSFNCLDGLINVQDLAVLHAIRIGAAEAEDLQLAEFILATGNDGNFGGSNVKPHNNWLLVVHVYFVFSCFQSLA